MRQALRREEWLLFLAPLAMLLLALWAGPLRRTYFPAPIPTPKPTPQPPPIPNLWSDYGDFYAMLPAKNGKVIYTLGGINNTRPLIRAWDARSGHQHRAFCNSGSINRDGIALSDDGQKIAYTGDNYFGESRLKEMRIGIYDAARGVRLRTLGTKPNSGTALFLPNSHTLLVGLDGRFQIWNTDNGKLLKAVSWRKRAAEWSSLRFPCVSHDGRVLALIRDEAQSGDAYANGRRDEIGLFSTRSWKRKRVLSWPQTSIDALAFVGDGQTLLIRTSTHRWAKKKSGANGVYPVTKLRMVDLKTRRERVVRTYQNYRDADVAVSPDGKYFALCETFTATTPPVNQTAAILWKKSFIEIRDGFSGKKIASLRADEGFHSNTAMVFASDNSALYFRNNVVERWPRARWKIGVPYSKIRAPGK